MRAHKKPNLRTLGPIIALPLVMLMLNGVARPTLAQQELDRRVLPIREPKRPLYTELDVRNAKSPPRFEVKAPADAPNAPVRFAYQLVGRRSRRGSRLRMPLEVWVIR